MLYRVLAVVGFAWVCTLTISLVPLAMAADESQKSPPAVGDAAPAVELKNVDDKVISLSALSAKQPVVVLFLRGYPGYQCPLCTRQVGAFLRAADSIKEAGARVLMIYPGPAEQLKEHAAEFVHGKTLPDYFDLVVDPDYVATNTWHLRWDAKNETAYPSTFVVDTAGIVRFAKVSKEHGDRSNPEEVVAAIKSIGK